MAKIISDYSELLAAVGALPKPPAGTVRVFRGQTEDYKTLSPSGLRRSPRLMTIWRVYSNHLYRALLQRENIGDLSETDLQAHQVWFDALAQQYGPGSDFLDVTYSIDIALWFALNRSKPVKAAMVMGQNGPPDPTRDRRTFADLVGYDQWEDEDGGCIYVLDLPLWNGDGLARAGQVIDLAKGPEVFSSSPRMRAQEGCLIYCRNDDHSPFDVRALLVEGTPLRVRRPMTGTAAPDRRVADIYPSPAQDEWFARFLSVPMAYSAQSPPTLQRSIPVAVYYDGGNQRYLNEVHFHDVAIHPALVHRFEPELRDRPVAGQPAPTIIVLEAPMVFPYAAADSDLWHHGLLWTDVPDHCPEYKFGTEGHVGDVSLTNVFFEFSLLEGIGWEQAIHKKITIDLHRGVWLRRSGETIVAAILDQQAPTGAVIKRGFLTLFYDASLGRIMAFFTNDNQTIFPIDALGDHAKPIIIALMLLRDLSPKLKVLPTPSLVVDKSKILVRIARDAARLYRVHPAPPDPDWFVLRNARNPEEPYTHASKAGGLCLETNLPFRDYPLAELLAALPSECS